jgi:WD40 repeat protein
MPLTRICLCEVGVGKQWRSMEGPADDFRSVVFAPDGSTIYAAGSRGLIRAWDVKTGKEKRLVESPTASLQHLTWTADGRRVVTAASDGYILFWEATSGKLLRTLGPYNEHLWRVQISNDERTLLTWGIEYGIRDRRLFPGMRITRLIDLRSGKERSLPSGMPRSAWPVLSPDGKWLAWQEEAMVGLWDLASGKRLHVLHLSDATSRGLVFSPDGRYLSIRWMPGSAYRGCRLWDLTGLRPRLRVAEACYLPQCDLFGQAAPCFSADSRTFIRLYNGFLRMYETATGAERGWLLLRPPPGRPLPPMFFSFAGRCGIDQLGDRVRLWPLEGSARPVELPWKWDRQPMLAFSPDGRLLASAAPDGSVLV